MKCPFCGEKLQQTYDGKQFSCSNYKDPTHPRNMLGTLSMWIQLTNIITREKSYKELYKKELDNNKKNMI